MRQDVQYGRRSSAWAGWIAFGAVAMIIIGLFNAIYGIVALVREEFFLVRDGQLLLFDLTAWGWILLIGGALAVAAGLAILAGQTWGRLLGVILLALNALGHLMVLPAYPMWSLLIIALDVVVIYALVVHGREGTAA